MLPWGDADGRFNVHWKTPGGMPGESFTSINAMLAAVERLKPHSDVYCCMSSQAVAGERLKKNARFLKSLFLDVDVKVGFYNSTSEAIAALNAFTGVVGLPPPTIRVLSGGGGFHCHWVVDRPLSRDEWLPLARALQRAGERHGLALDQNVIVDASRVLRVPNTTNFKYPHRPLVSLHSSIVERDYSADEIAGPLALYMRAGTLTARKLAQPCMTQSALLDGADLSVNDDLSAGLFNFDEFKDAVEFLTGKGWFGAHQYDHMIKLCWACGYIEIREPAHADDARALYSAVVDATGRDPATNDQRYADGLQRTPERIRAGEEIVTPGTIFKSAREQGWAPATTTAPPAAPAHAISLAIAKAQAADAYKTGELASRSSALSRLARFCATIADPSLRRELAKTVAALLAADGWPLPAIVDSGTFLGLQPPDAASLAQWAIRKFAGDNP